MLCCCCSVGTIEYCVSLSVYILILSDFYDYEWSVFIISWNITVLHHVHIQGLTCRLPHGSRNGRHLFRPIATTSIQCKSIGCPRAVIQWPSPLTSAPWRFVWRGDNDERCRWICVKSFQFRSRLLIQCSGKIRGQFSWLTDSFGF